jgi:hypothetical protein
MRTVSWISWSVAPAALAFLIIVELTSRPERWTAPAISRSARIFGETATSSQTTAARSAAATWTPRKADAAAAWL